MKKLLFDAEAQPTRLADVALLLLGMYYQQLLFWSFTLVAATGAGRYSLDYWLSKRIWRVSSAARRMVGAAAVFVLLSIAAPAQELPRLKMRELRGLAQQWEQGSLTYLDYTSGRTVTLKTRLNGMQSRADELVLDFIYTEPEGQQVKGYDKLRVLPDGRRVVWDGQTMKLTSKTRLPNGDLRLVLAGSGTDNNQPCQLRRTVVLGPRLFSVVKEVCPSGAPAFLVRNTYRFER